MATIASLDQIQARASADVSTIGTLEEATSYPIPAPVQAYSGDHPDSDPVWQGSFCAALEGKSPRVNLYKLGDSFVTVNGAIFTGGAFVVRESLYPYVRMPDILDAFYPNLVLPEGASADGIRFGIRAMRRESGPLLFAREHGEAGYFHWLHSIMPRIAQYEANGLNSHRLMLALSEPFQRDSLGVLGIAPERYCLSTGTTMFCEELYFCSPMVSPDLGRSGGFFERSLYATRMLRGLTEGMPYAGRRLYISRQDAKIRRLLVEDEVAAALTKDGFEIVTLTGMKFRDQVAMFASAAVVVSMHGAGLSNIAFMPPGGVVVELLAPDRLWPTYRGIAARAGLHYAPYIGSRAGEQQARDSDLMVDENHFTRFVATVIDMAGKKNDA